MKKIIGIVSVILVIVGGVLGYKVLYKKSPRDFITADTRVIYVNEDLNGKDFTPLLTLINDNDVKERLKSNLTNLKYVSKFYLFSDREFYDLDEKSFTGVIDTGFYYFLALKELDKYFELNDDIYIMRKDVRERYFPKMNEDIFMKNYRGLIFISLGEKNLKDFIAKEKKYLYNKEIEETLDEKRDSLLGTLIYNNRGTEFYGVDLFMSSVTIKNENIVSESSLIFDKNESQIFKSTKENRELSKYIETNDIYISVDDFSKLDRLIFNPLIIGADVDSRAIISLWKNLLGIDIEKMLNEIDGEVLFKLDRKTLMLKLKDEAPEIKRVIEILKNEDSILYLDEKIEERDGVLIIGENNLAENIKAPFIDKGVFIYGNLNSIDELEGFETKFEGKNNKIIIESKIPMELSKYLLNSY